MTDVSREARWFLTALWFLFITLKLTGVIAWSWWWVNAPFWAPLMLALIVFFFVITSPGRKP